MSHIFDALQRSDTERSGKKASAFETVTELLERMESMAYLQRESEENPGDFLDPKLAGAGLELSPEAIEPDGLARKDLTSSDVERRAERVKFLSELPAISVSPSAASRLVCLTDKETPAAEAFRLLDVRLRNIRKARPLKKVMITGTTPEEGKSFVSANLACALASASKEKILLVGGDLRRPALSSIFGTKMLSGICEYLRGEQSLASCIYRLEQPGIWFLPPGRPQGDPLEIIQSTKLPRFTEQLAEWFDWIIIDSPPVLPLADTTAWARLADGLILVARRNVTGKRKLKKGIEAFESKKLIGAILNCSNSASDKEYYYYRHEIPIKAHARVYPD
jgi:capsular exopolysaccharide synthesis family protein